MKRNKKTTMSTVTAFCVIALLFMILAECVAVAVLLNLDMLPEKYMLLVMALFGVITIVVAVLMFLRGSKPVSLARRIFAWMLAALTVCGCVVLSLVIMRVQETMNKVTGQPVTTETREVFVLAEDPAKTIADAANYKFGVVENYDVECTEKAIAAIEKETGATIQTVAYKTVFDMVDALYESQNMAIILNEAYTAILEEYPGYTDFVDKTRVLYEAELEVAAPEQPTGTKPEDETTAAPTEPKRLSEAPFIMYLSGSDTRNKTLKLKTRSDVNILAVVNPKTHQVLLLNTPRDYYVPNSAGGGMNDKLAHCGVYGIDCSLDALEGLYDINIDYYAKINFTGFETLIDSVGGVTVYSDASFTAGAKRDVRISKGENHLDGREALAFARERKHVSGGDNGRGKNQMKVVTAVLEKMTSGTTIISNFSDILESLEGMFITDAPMDQVSELVKLQLDEMPSWEIFSFAVTGRNGMAYTYSNQRSKSSVMYKDAKHVAYASELVHRLLDDEILTQADMTYPQK